MRLGPIVDIYNMKDLQNWFGMFLLNEKGVSTAVIRTSGHSPSRGKVYLEIADNSGQSTGKQADISVETWETNDFHQAWPQDKDWHEIVVEISNGQAAFRVDNIDLGAIAVGNVFGIAFHGSLLSGMYVDDIEFYIEQP